MADPVDDSKKTKAELLAEVTQLRAQLQATSAVEQAALPPGAYCSLILENSRDAICLVSPDNRVLYINAAVQRLLGYAPEEIIGRIGTDFFHPSDRRIFERFNENPMPPGADQSFTARCFQKNGRIVWLEIKVTMLRDQPISGAIVSLHDVTERQRTETDLQLTRHELSAIVRASPLAVIALDAGMRVTLWSRAATGLYGWREAEMLGKLFPSDEAATEQLRLVWQQTIALGASVDGVDAEHRRKNGSPLSVRIFAAPLHDGTGAIIGSLLMVWDRAEEKVALAERLALYESEQRARWAAEAATTQLSRLLQAARTIADAGLDPGEVYSSVAKSICDALADSCTIFMRSPQRQHLEVAGVFSPEKPAAPVPEIRLDAAAEPFRDALELGRLVRVTVADDPHIPVALTQGRAHGPSALLAPLRARGEIIGAVMVHRHDPERPFSEQEQAILQYLAARAHRAATLERARLDAMMQHLPVGVLFRDTLGKPLMANAAMMALSAGTAGRTEVAVANLRFDVCTPTGESLDWREFPSIRALQREEITSGEELTVRVAGGRLVPVLASASPVRDATGAMIGVVMVAQDISALKEAEQQRNDLLATRARLEGITLTAREAAHLISNDIAVATGIFDLLEGEIPLDPSMTNLMKQAVNGLVAAREHLIQLQRVARVVTKETAAGASLDLSRSIIGAPAEALDP